MLDKEYQYYTNNRDTFLKEYNGKYIVIKDENILGVYNTQIEALSATSQNHEVGTFLIQHVTTLDEEQIQRFFSRVYV